jgi:hypothetical protein
MAGRGVVPAIFQRVHRLEFIARTEEAIGRSEQAITRQLILIATLTTNRQAANDAWELLRVTEEHLAELHVGRQLLLDASAA